MGIKKVIPVILCLFLVASFIFVNFSFTSPETKVYINPTEKTVYLYDTFAIDVNVADATHLYTYDIKLYYYTIPVDGLSVDLPPGHFLEPTDDTTNLAITHKEIDDNYNASHGRVWVSIRLLPVHLYGGPNRCARCILQKALGQSQRGKTGNGVLFTITFHCTEVGRSVIDLHETQLIEFWGSPISHTCIQGSVNVFREA